MAGASCHLLGGLFASFIQGCLALVCIGTLVIKRQQEIPRRDWIVWFLDVMKQGLGSSFGHFSNIYLSMVIAQSVTSGDECQWYCLTYIVDCTFGTALNIFLLYLFERGIRSYPAYCQIVFNFGDYGDPPQLFIFLPQLLVWLCIVIITKIFILVCLFHLISPIDMIISDLFYPLRHVPDVELVLVMIVIPTILNTLQFWITDTFLKRHLSTDSMRSIVGESLDSGDSPEDLGRGLIVGQSENNSSNKSSSNRRNTRVARTRRSVDAFSRVSNHPNSYLTESTFQNIWRRLFSYDSINLRDNDDENNMGLMMGTSLRSSAHSSNDSL